MGFQAWILDCAQVLWERFTFWYKNPFKIPCANNDFFFVDSGRDTCISKLAKLSLLNESSVSITVSQVKGIGYIMPLNVLLTTFNLNLQSFIILKPRFFKKVSSCQVLMSTWSTTALSRQATCPLY